MGDEKNKAGALVGESAMGVTEVWLSGRRGVPRFVRKHRKVQSRMTLRSREARERPGPSVGYMESQPTEL